MKPTKITLVIAVLALGAALAYGPRWMGGGNPAGMPGTSAALQGTQHGQVATFLGLSLEQLTALRLEGKTLADIARERGVDPAKLEAQLINSRNTAIDQAVKQGTLSAAQASWLKTRSEALVKATLSRPVGPNSGLGYGSQGNRDGAGPGHGPQRAGGRWATQPQPQGPRWNR